MRRMGVVLSVVAVYGALCLCPVVSASIKQVAVLQPSDAASGYYFGYSVSASENVIATTGNGAVFMFVKPRTGWANMTQTATLTASDGTSFQYVSLNGNVVVASGYNTAAYVFIKSTSGWTDMTQTAVL